MQNTRLNHWNPFSYDVRKSCDSVVVIVGVYEKQFSKNCAGKFSKLQKIYKISKNGYDDVIKPSDGVIISGSKFLNILVITYLHAKNHCSNAFGLKH